MAEGVGTRRCAPVKDQELEINCHLLCDRLSASPAIAQGGGGFGATLGAQNVGPRYPGDEEKDVGGCVWRRQWTLDDRGHRVLRRVRVCY